jgi:hypothetical protein
MPYPPARRDGGAPGWWMSFGREEGDVRDGSLVVGRPLSPKLGVAGLVALA